MVASTEIADRIERGLYALTAEVDWLPNTVQEWDDTADAERVAILLDWDHLLIDYLPELEQFYRARAMTIIQQARYRQLRWKIKDALPLFERLGVRCVPVAWQP